MYTVVSYLFVKTTADKFWLYKAFLCINKFNVYYPIALN